MGRIGKRSLKIPSGVEVKTGAGIVTVKGPKGLLTQAILPVVKIVIDNQQVTTNCDLDDRESGALQGTYNALIKNMITGVTIGFEKNLELVGVGYRAQMQGKKLQLQVGYSHLVDIEPPEGVEFSVAGNNKIKIIGIDAQKVGQIASEIRLVREVEPYKGKGIKYANEIVRRKAGKAAKAAAGGAA